MVYYFNPLEQSALTHFCQSLEQMIIKYGRNYDITLGEGSLSPGIGVNKELPQIGDLFITGIVNIAGLGGQMLLQTTRLSIVMKLADFIATGIYCCLSGSKSRSALQRTKQRNFIDVL